MKKRIIAAVAVFGLLGGILYFAYAQTAAQNNVKHFTAFFAVEGEAIDQNNDMKKEIARLTPKSRTFDRADGARPRFLPSDGRSDGE